MYPTDLTDRQWELIKPLVQEIGAGRGRPHKSDVRREVNALLYVLRTGCQWRCLPSEYGAWSQVYAWFRRRRQIGTWDRVLKVLREAERTRRGKKATPTVAIIDSQSVKTVQKGGNADLMPARKQKAASGISR